MMLITAIVLTSTMLTGSQNAAASDEAIVKIHSNTQWSGSILDSSFDSATQAGSGDLDIPFVCSSGIFFGGTYSLVFQKQTDKGGLKVSVMQNNQTLDSKSTTAAYGVVSLSGNCG